MNQYNPLVLGIITLVIGVILFEVWRINRAIKAQFDEWARPKKDGEAICDFCGLAHDVVGSIVTGMRTRICIRCARRVVATCADDKDAN
jgi:hypothetical protein